MFTIEDLFVLGTSAHMVLTSVFINPGSSHQLNTQHSASSQVKRQRNTRFSG